MRKFPLILLAVVLALAGCSKASAPPTTTTTQPPTTTQLQTKIQNQELAWVVKNYPGDLYDMTTYGVSEGCNTTQTTSSTSCYVTFSGSVICYLLQPRKPKQCLESYG